MNAMERFEQWCNNPYFDQATRAELRALAEAGDTKATQDRFYRDLAFGTGGLRGILGAGSNRAQPLYRPEDGHPGPGQLHF